MDTAIRSYDVNLAIRFNEQAKVHYMNKALHHVFFYFIFFI